MWDDYNETVSQVQSGSFTYKFKTVVTACTKTRIN